MHTSQLDPVLDTSIEMKTVLFLLALGYASSDKLDLSYLPPPGSQYAGGRPGDLQFPLEFPKETFSTTLRPQAGDNRGLNPEDYKATIGIDRVPGVQNIDIVTPGSNSNRVPTTTVSYAFTQTTTHPPTEGFETTISPQGGFPTTDIFNNFPSQEQGSIYDGNFNTPNHPNYQQTGNQFGQTLVPTSGPFNPQQPGLGYQGNVNQFGQPTGAPTSGPIHSLHPTGQQHNGQILNQAQPGYRQSISGLPGATATPSEIDQLRNQTVFGNIGVGQGPNYVPSTVSPQYYPTTSQPSATIYGDRLNNLPDANIPSGGFIGQQPQINGQPGLNVQTNQPGQQQYIDGQDYQQVTGSQLPNQFGGLRQPSSTAAPTYTPGFVNQPNSGIVAFPDTRYPGAQNINAGDIANRQQYLRPEGNIVDGRFQPSSTIAPTSLTDESNQRYPEGTPVSLGQQYPTSITPSSYSTPSYPGVQGNTGYRQRPERPQAEADRNAVILNYESIITPEGHFAYSYDTSNGIHADESGTAADGVKAKGSYSYTGDDGKVYSIVYTADEDGFRPRGDHLPTPPPIPEAIQRIIDQVEKEKELGITHDGSYDEDKYGHKKYQGAVKNRPYITENIDSGSEVFAPGERVQHTKQHVLSHPGYKRPIVSTENDEEADLEPGLKEEQEIINHRTRPGQISTQRPNSNTYDIDEDDSEGGDLDGVFDDNESVEEGSTKKPFTEVTRRPGNQSVRKQYNQNRLPASDDSSFRTGDRRRPAGKIPSTQIFDRDQETENQNDRYDAPKYKAGTKNRYVNKETSAQPIDYEEQYENVETTAPHDFEDKISSKRPSSSKPLRRPGSQIDAEYEEVDQHQRRPGTNIPSRRPVSSGGRFENKPAVKEFYNRIRGGSKRPSNRPSTFAPEEYQDVTDEYSTEEDYVTKLPSRLRPGTTKTSNKFVSMEKYRPGGSRRPSNQGLKEYHEDSIENSSYQPEENDYTESNEDADTENQYDNERDVSSDGLPSTVSTFTKNERNRGKPQTVKTTDSNGRISELEDKRLYAPRPSPKFGQKIIPSKYDQQTQIIDNNVNRPVNGSGYQYIPPQNKFEEEVRKSSNSFTGPTGRPTTGRPAPSTPYYDDKRTISSSRPFMTPNVSRFNGNPENPNQEYTPGQQQYQLTGDNISTTPDQVYGDETLSTGPADKFISSTKRPGHYHTTGRPQHFEQHPHDIPGFSTEQGTEKGKPSQKYNDRFYETTKTPYRVVSSTTPMPSTRPQAPILRPSRPGYQDQTYYTDASYKKVPGQTYVSSTTPFPSETPDFDGSNQSTIKPQYQTTFTPEGTRPTYEYEDQTSAQRFPTKASTDLAVDITPGVSTKYQKNLPSTTYRPNYGIRGQPSSTARPSIDKYGRPVFDRTSQRLPSAGVDKYGRPITPEYGTTAQEYTPGSYNEPSSTVTPGLSVDAFGRPITGPVQGNIPTDQFGPTGRPGVAADKFGRPISKPQGTQFPSSTTSPVLVDAYGRPITTPGFTSQEYTSGASIPKQPSFGGQFQPNPIHPVDQGYAAGLPTNGERGHLTSISASPDNFRGNQKYQPGVGQDVSSTFRPSTVKGEDFSGPKQQQRFDPERGYYY